MVFFNYDARMNKILTYVAAVLVAPAASVALAGSCYSLGGDARALCLAKTKAEPSYCYSIQAPGPRATCFAEVRR